MSRDSADDNQQLPPWLRGLPLPPRPPGSPADRADGLPTFAQNAPAAVPPTGGDQTPSWLADLSASVDATPAVPGGDETPSWLADLSASVDATPAASGGDETPSWLADLSASVDAAPAAPGSDETPSWLRDLGAADTTPAAPRSEETPSWLADLSASVDAAPAASGSDETPSWLRDLGAADTTPTPATSGGDATPSWLADLSASVDAAPAASGSDETPPWLGNLTDSATSTASEAGLPDWLHSAGREPPAQPSGQNLSSPPDAEEGLPDWLRSAAAAPPTPAPPAPSAAEAQPSWLMGRGDETTEPVPPTAPPQNAAPDAMPDWLRGSASTDFSARPNEDVDPTQWLDNTIADAAPPSSTGGGAPAASDDADDTDIPSWLRDIPTDEIRRVMEADDEEEIAVEPFSFDMGGDTSEATTATDVPSWLSDIGGGASGDADSTPAWFGDLSTGPARPASASEAPEVPLWLQDLGAAPASEPDAGIPVASAPEVHAPAPAPQDEMPAWLRDAGSTQPPASSLPAWLQAEPSSSAPLSSPELPNWLKEEAPTTPPAGDMPTWLQAEPPAAPPPTPSAESVPAWLQAEPPAAPPPAENIPAWLQSALPAADALAVPPAGLEAPPAATPPAWLSDAPISAPPTEAPRQPSPAPADDLPAWLREDAPAPPAADPLPNWLNARAPAEPPHMEPPRVEPPAPAADDLPPWLRDEVGQPLPTAGTPGDANLPEWLRGATDLPAEPDRRRAEPPAAPGPLGADWFDEAPSAAGRASAGENEFFGGAELPAWLRKAEAEPVVEINPTDARSLDWLTKLGAQEEENAAAIAAPSAKLPLPITPARTAPQLSAIALLDHLAANLYPEAAPLPAPLPLTLLQRIGLERMLYVVLLLVLLTALAVPSLAANLQSPPEAPGAAELFQQIDSLTDKDVVLIGYEWDARRISEMKPLEQAVIGQLIQKQVKLVLVSTDPQGTLLLFDLRDELDIAGYGRGGEDYILLGYKPGGELALRSLAQDFQGALRADFQGNDATIGALAGGSKTGKVLTSLSDLSMILVLADDAVDVQSWFEQIRRSAPQQPLAFLLPAEAAPIVQPYLQPPRDSQIAPIYHLAGKQGALAYEQLRGSGHTPTVQVERETGQQRLGILVFVVLLLIGGVIVGVGGILRRRTGA